MTNNSVKPCLFIFSGHFSELSIRYSEAMSKYFDIVLFLERRNFDSECENYLLIRSDKFRIVAVDGLVRVKFMPVFLLYLLKYRPAIIQFEEILDKWFPIFVLISKFFSKITLRVHDPDLHSGKDSEVSKGVLRGRKLVRERADLVLVHGKFCEDRFAFQYKTNTLNTTHGVLLVPSKGQLKLPKLNSILMFGRMEDYKGLDILIAALNILANQKIHPLVKVVGTGSELTKLKAVLENLPNVTVIQRYVSPNEAIALYQSCEASVLPYKNATQSGVIAAAFGNGRPVIASNVGGIPDIVVDGVNGILCPPNDPSALANSIKRFMTETGLPSILSQGAVNSANNELNWNEICVQVSEAYFQLISVKSKGVK